MWTVTTALFDQELYLHSPDLMIEKLKYLFFVLWLNLHARSYQSKDYLNLILGATPGLPKDLTCHISLRHDFNQHVRGSREVLDLFNVHRSCAFG